ncbi:MAG: VOC family protein [Pseudomonadota bacterium]
MPGLIQQEDNCLDYVEFVVSDIEKSKEFYGGVFGWTFTDYSPDYCEFSDGRMKGGFTTQGKVQPGGALVVIYHNDPESILNKILAAGGLITVELFQFPGGERFQFTDLDGYELAVWRKL